jgi:long-chain acyl-CoA synthetase
MSGWVISDNGTTQRQEKNRDQRSSDAFGHLALIVTDMRETLVSFLDDCLARGGETVVVGREVCELRDGPAPRLRLGLSSSRASLKHVVSDVVTAWCSGAITVRSGSPHSSVSVARRRVVPIDVKSAPDFVERVKEQVSPKMSLTEFTFDHHSAAAYTATQINADDLVEIVFTSGTTADPKGVCLTHRNLLANLNPIEKEFRKYGRWERLVHPLRFLCLLPLSHVFGQLMGIFVPLMVGGEVHFLESYKPSEIIDTAKKQRINAVVTVPRVLETLREKICMTTPISIWKPLTTVTSSETGGLFVASTAASAGASGPSSAAAQRSNQTSRLSGSASAMQSFRATA